jgi:hypothetical protein
MKAKNVNLSSIKSIAGNSKRVWDRVHLTYHILIIPDGFQSHSTDGSHRHLINLMKSRCDETINMVKPDVYSCMLEEDFTVLCLHFVPSFYIYIYRISRCS